MGQTYTAPPSDSQIPTACRRKTTEMGWPPVLRPVEGMSQPNAPAGVCRFTQHDTDSIVNLQFCKSKHSHIVTH